MKLRGEMCSDSTYWMLMGVGLTLVTIVILSVSVGAYRNYRQGTPQPTTTTRHMQVTAYCPCSICCGRWADGITASGQPVTANGGRFVAADRSLPFGTLVTVPGYADGEPVPVLDRGGAISGDRLDVFFPLHSEALEFGVRWLDVQIGG